MSAAERLSALDTLPARDLCSRAAAALSGLADVMNQETMLLRAGRFRESVDVTAEKTRLAQDYVGIARSVQRQSARLRQEAPDALSALRAGHERLATQMAENLRVIATARTVTEDLMAGTAAIVGQKERTRTYPGPADGRQNRPEHAARGIAVNRAL
jgi:hypothetical protein